MIKKTFAIIFICGWLFPKVSIGGFNLGVQDITAIFILLYNYRIDKKILRYFDADIFFTLLLLLLGLFHLEKGDYEGLLIAMRTLLFLLAVLSFTSFNLSDLNFIISKVFIVNIFFVIISVSRILFNILLNPFDILNFFYGSDSFRVRAPFEPEGAASSQVPIGYMLALFLCLPIVNKSIFSKVIFILGAIGTTSRASVLSIALLIVRKLRVTKISGVLSFIVVAFLVYVVFLKSFSLHEGQLDGSAGKRLDLYESSIKIIFNNPISLFVGFGLSTNSLSKATGEGFYESFLVNSLMQGGGVLFLLSIWIIVKTFYFDFKYKLFNISLVVFLGNLVGGSNYFSMYAYPLMSLIVVYAFKNK